LLDGIDADAVVMKIEKYVYFVRIIVRRYFGDKLFSSKR
jgi:hypothetical protein